MHEEIVFFVKRRNKTERTALMHVKGLLHKVMRNTCSSMHQTRASSLLDCCEGLLIGQTLTVTAIGRSIQSPIAAKHTIKRADRLLSNRFLQQEVLGLYGSLSQLFISGALRPVILVDWSDLTSTRRHYLLRACLAVKGRPITLYEEVHTQADGRETHQRFLEQLKRFLHPGAVPIIVADAGFRGTWFRQIEALGWDWVGRIRGHTLCAWPDSEEWFSCQDLIQQATHHTKHLGSAQIIRNQGIVAELYSLKRLPKHRRVNNLDGSRSQRRKSLENATREKEPWLIATSLQHYSAKTIIKYYALRMQIEESFRDTKNVRYGLSLRLTGTRDTGRLRILMLLAYIVSVLLFILGTASEAKGLQYSLQPNTLKHRRVLSVNYLACLLIRWHKPIKIKYDEIIAAIQSLRALILFSELT